MIIAVDFSSAEENLKIYNRYKKLDPELINKFFKNNKTKRTGSTINIFLLLNREKSAHFYILYRFSKHSLKSIKINKVYDFKDIKDINNSLKEMEIFIKKFDKKGEKSCRI